MTTNDLDKLVQVSANNTLTISQIGEVLRKQADDIGNISAEFSELKTWLVDNIHVDSADKKRIRRAVAAKVKEEVGTDKEKRAKAFSQLYHYLEDHGKGSELGETKKIAVDTVLAAIPNWRYRDDT